MLLHMVSSTRLCGCGSKEPVRGHVQCVGLYPTVNFIHDARSHIRQIRPKFVLPWYFTFLTSFNRDLVAISLFTWS